MKNGVRLISYTAIALLLLAGATWLLRTPPRFVQTSVVDRGEVEVTLREEGRARVHDRYVVSTPAAGHVVGPDWHAGDRVRAGELLAQLYPSTTAPADPHLVAQAETAVVEAGAILQAAQATADAARARVEFSEREFNRSSELFRTGDVSRDALDQLEHALQDAVAHLRSANFAIDIARHELDAARWRVDHLVETANDRNAFAIRAPVPGIILSRSNQGEGTLQAGEPLLEIGDPATLEIHASVATRDAVQLQPGTPARIVDWGGHAVLEARVRHIEPSAVTRTSAAGTAEQRTRVIAGITSAVENWERLGDNYPVVIEFLAWRAEGVLRVPASAVFREEDRWMVLRLHGDRVYRTPVTTGRHGERYVEIQDGLETGDIVVVYADSRLDDGQRVVER